VGIGIGFSLQRLDFHVKSALRTGATVCDTVVYIDGLEARGWTFEETNFDDDQIICVALNDVGQRSVADSRVITRFKELTFDDLIAGSQPRSEQQSTDWDDFSKKDEKPCLAVRTRRKE